MNENQPKDTHMNEKQPEEATIRLYQHQKELLDTFLEHKAITQAQYDKSLGDLTIKMGMEDYKDKV